MRSVCMIAGLAAALGAQTPELRFRVETAPASAMARADQQAEFGFVNRVRYRVARSTDRVTVERETVAPPDPQGGTRARPAAAAGGHWTPEGLGAPPGTQALAWGDFDNDGSDELLTGWPAAIWKHGPSGQ